MGYQRDDESWRGNDRWQDRGRGGYQGERSQRGGWGRDSGRDDDRGFFERAGDEVRSWFGDDDAERRRDMDERRYERERGTSSHYGGDNRSSWTGRDRDQGRGDRWNREERMSGRGDGDYRVDTWGAPAGGLASGSGFGGDYERGRRFDRIDAGSTGTHGAHPMSAPVSGGYDTDYGTSAGSYRSSARYADVYDRDRSRGGGGHDPHYSEWRNRQLESLDRDYDDYRREHQSKFEQEFGSWREKRQSQRQLLGRVREHMEVVGSDGQHVGTVDKVRGDRVLLTKSDSSAGGHHHSVPCSWIDKVDDKVTINKSAEDARHAWRDEETSRALFERDDNRQEGPHALDRSFSGTYR